MSYIKPIGSNISYEVSVIPTITQNGYQAIMFIGEDVPDDLRTGFNYYDDDDTLIANYSKYNDFYKHNIYSVKKDIPVDPKPNNTPPATGYVVGSEVEAMLIDLNSKVNDLEPYTDSKKAYIDDTEVIFDCDKTGIISAWIIIDGVRTECRYEVTEGKIRVFFEPLEVVSEVFIQIQ